MNPVHSILQHFELAGLTLTGITDDSRQVRPGDLFLAYPGDLADGRHFIADALDKGAAGVIWQPGGDFQWQPEWTVPQLATGPLRALAGPLAHAIYGHPSEALSLIAVTGTNGKTTITQCIARAHPERCAVIGTLGAGFPDALAETGFTTPEATTLMRSLAEFRAAGARACALEASSIGIEEGRMDGLRIDVAIHTNFTRDHLDYHGSMEAYAAAKARLFSWPHLRLAIVNLDDELGRKLALETTATRVLGYTLSEARQSIPAVIRAEQLHSTAEGQSFTLVLPTGKAEVHTPLVGQFNIANLLAIAAVLFDCNLSASDIARRLSSLQAPAGRMERVIHAAGPLVAVDYAHTPDALENALISLKPVASERGGKLCVVFGCGGGRDAGKRPVMGQVAEQFADTLILTDDNPRFEASADILAAIAEGAPSARIIAERATAIDAAIAQAAAADVVLIAGKGHENYQERGGERLPFSDTQEAKQALQKHFPIQDATPSHAGVTP